MVFGVVTAWLPFQVVRCNQSSWLRAVLQNTLRIVATRSWLAAQPLAGAAAHPELVLPDRSSMC